MRLAIKERLARARYMPGEIERTFFETRGVSILIAQQQLATDQTCRRPSSATLAGLWGSQAHPAGQIRGKVLPHPGSSMVGCPFGYTAADEEGEEVEGIAPVAASDVTASVKTLKTKAGKVPTSKVCESRGTKGQ